VVYTDYRPVPLEYYALMAGQKSMLLLKNKKGELKHENFEKLSKLIKHPDDEMGTDPKAAKKRGGQGGLVQDIKKIVGVLHAKNMTPGILFAFSKKDVELIAKEISKEMSLLSADQKRALDSMFNSTIQRLSEEDQKLPQITALRGILIAGIGLHHGGMLPILKELVELLFQSGLIKVLVSTETFSMGINMPAKSVVFTSVQKWDGEKFRVLSGSEFVQMAGRAGRRGLDDRGFVITMMDQNIDFKKFNLSLRNESKHDPLISQFSLSYNMILNAMTMEGFAPEEMILKSFKQFQYDQNTQKHEMLLEEWQQTVQMLQRHWFGRDPRRFQALLSIIHRQKQLKKIDQALNQVLTDPKNSLNFLQIGRLIQVKGCGWVPFINFAKVDQRIIVDVVASVNYTKNPALAKKVLCSCVACLDAQDLTLGKEPAVTSIDLKSIMAISSIVIIMPQNLIEIKPRLQVRELVAKVIREFRHEVPLLNLIADIPVADDTIRKLVQDKQEARKGVVDHIAKLKADYKTDFLAGSPTAPQNQPLVFQNRLKIEELLASNIDTSEVSYLRGKMQEIMAPKDWAARAGKPEKKPDQILAKELQSMRLFLRVGKKIRTVFSDSHSDYTMVLFSEFSGMKKVLQRLEFFDKEEILTPKGKVASRICGADELLLTQMMFEGHLSDLNARLSAILLSFIVNEDRASAKKPPKISDEKLMKAFEASKKTAKFLNAIYGEYNLASLTEEDLMETLNPSLFDTIQKWYDGGSFADICKTSPQYEGNLIRSIKRLFELLKELIDAADSLGNKELRERFREGQEKLYRGIVFAASLYL
jgi:ATP-dependent RNA helicase DOB1